MPHPFLIKEIAQQAGLSEATVDRVLNNRNGVRKHTAQRVKQAIDIVDLVGSYLPLRREGRGFRALCPWHDDTKPSLQVNPERQSYRCWVCNIGGDVFSFVMQHDKVTFPEALQMLATMRPVR